ncbi:MFS transporter [Propionicicella superfundia]|uniref:MFS transporter n=1 Tax=Propionicicella superfundia TaxID=348582 RepID=UPI001FDFA070|nr:MFS transporter [Propionicicella superfundia]
MVWRGLGGMREAARFPRSVWVLSFNGFLVALGFGVMVPVLPVYAKTFGVDNLALGFVVSAFAFMRLVTSPFCGWINRWLGERNAIAIGMTIVGMSSAAMGLSQTFAQLLVFRMLGGVGSAMFTVAALALLLASAPEDLRGRASGVYQGGFLLGGMAGPAVGGLLAAVSLTAPFYFYAATLFAAAALVTLLLRGGRAAAHRSRPAASRPFRQVVADVRYQAACAMAFGQGWQSFGVRNALVPIVVVEGLHQDTTWTGTAFAVAAVCQTIALFPIGRIVDRVGRRPVMIAAGVVCGTSTLLIPLAPTIGWLIVILSAYGIGAAMQGTAPTAAVGDATGGGGGTPVAVFSMTSDVGSIVGPIVAGWLADRFSIPVAFTVGAAILLGGAVYALFMPRERPPADRPPGPTDIADEAGGSAAAVADAVDQEGDPT